MSSLILNREFQHPADGWYMIEPAGEHLNETAGVLQVIDDAAIRSIVDTFNAAAEAWPAAHDGAPYPGMLIDRDHFSLDPNKETVALGWLERLEARPSGIFGTINWTESGRKFVDGGDYRFFSTIYDSEELELVQSGNPPKKRPLALSGLALTNRPNNKGGLPITNRAHVGKNVRTVRNPVDALRVLIRIRQIEQGERFVDAWNRTRVANRELHDAAMRFSGKAHRHMLVSNRAVLDRAAAKVPPWVAPHLLRAANMAGEATIDQLWQLIQGGEQYAFERMRESLDPPSSHDRGFWFYSEPDRLREDFHASMKVLMSKGMDYTQAWDHIADTEPLFFSRYVLVCNQ